MTIEEQYTQLLEKEQEAKTLDFLKTLNDEQRKALVPHIKKLSKEYNKFEQVGDNYKSKATFIRRTIFSYSAFVCYNRKDFEKENSGWIISKEHLDKILYWYSPSWLNDYINGSGDKRWLPLDYEYLMELTEKGFLQPQSDIIARLLPAIIYEHKNEVVNKQHVHTTQFKPENVLRHSITLQEHIWYLFEYETNISYTNQWIHFEGRAQNLDLGWMYVLKKYSSEGNIDRQRLLQEALLASNRNFNKNLSGWFADLFVQLQPGSEELLSLQPELFSLFSSPHSKVANTALQVCKQVVSEAGFDADNFLGYVPVLIASDTKSVAVNALQLLEKLAKKHTDKRQPICLHAAGTFIHKDDNLQVKAARLIIKYGHAADEEVKELLMQYSAFLFSTTKQLLEPFIATKMVEATEAHQLTATQQPFKQTALSAETALPKIHDIDELVFLISQAFDNNQSYHIDLIIAALIHLQKQITGTQIAKLEPAFQRAFKLFYGDWRSNIGFLDQLLAYLVLDYGVLLMQQHPEASTSLFDLYGGFMDKIEGNKKLWNEHKPNIGFMSGWKTAEGEVLYDPYKTLFKMVLERLKANEDAPLLSTPTHSPAWIDPKTLVERIYYYQQHRIVPDITDYQIAISRCWLHHTQDALAVIHEKLEGEEKELMLFLLDPGAKPQAPFLTEWAWMMAALSKSPDVVYPEFDDFEYQDIPRERFTGQYVWKTFEEDYHQEKYHWEKGEFRTEKVPAKRKALRLQPPMENDEAKKENGIKKFFTKLITGTKQKAAPQQPLLYDFFHIKNDFFATEQNDIKRLMMLVPNNPEPIVALAIRKCLSDPSFYGETNKRFVIQVIQGLHSIWKPFGEITHLFIATCMISSDKTAASYAAEIWMRGVTENTIDSTLIGTMLGKHESVEFAPLKRFTDLVINQLFGISPSHTKALEQLLIAMLKELPADPIKNLKKLLEIYFEVVAINNSAVENIDVKNLLHTWKKNAGLSKVIKTIV